MGLVHIPLSEPNTEGLFSFCASLTVCLDWTDVCGHVGSQLKAESLQSTLKEVKMSLRSQAPGHLTTPSVKPFCHLENLGSHF